MLKENETMTVSNNCSCLSKSSCVLTKGKFTAFGRQTRKTNVCTKCSFATSRCYHHTIVSYIWLMATGSFYSSHDPLWWAALNVSQGTTFPTCHLGFPVRTRIATAFLPKGCVKGLRVEPDPGSRRWLPAPLAVAIGTVLCRDNGCSFLFQLPVSCLCFLCPILLIGSWPPVPPHLHLQHTHTLYGPLRVKRIERAPSPLPKTWGNPPPLVSPNHFPAARKWPGQAANQQLCWPFLPVALLFAHTIVQTHRLPDRR